jgi:hypothetical protein
MDRTPPPFSRAAAALACAAALAGALAQPPAAGLDAELVTTGLYLVRGGGAHSLVRLSAGGLVVVDAKAPGQYRPLMAQVRRISRLSDMPVRVLVLTGGDERRAGNVAAFEAAGVRVVAARAVAARLPAACAADGTPAAPPIAFDGDYALRIGGIQARVVHLGPAPGGDASVVLFPDLRVVALGELLTSSETKTAPQGEERERLRAAMDKVLKLDFDRAVPADGPIVSRAELEAFSSKLEAPVAGR